MHRWNQRFSGTCADENRADRYTELPLARPATPNAEPSAPYLRDPVKAATARAVGAVRPQDAFQLRLSCGFVMEPRGGLERMRPWSSLAAILYLAAVCGNI